VVELERRGQIKARTRRDNPFAVDVRLGEGWRDFNDASRIPPPLTAVTVTTSLLAGVPTVILLRRLTHSARRTLIEVAPTLASAARLVWFALVPTCVTVTVSISMADAVDVQTKSCLQRKYRGE